LRLEVLGICPPELVGTRWVVIREEAGIAERDGVLL
jgi:hypothetical protein